LEAAFYTSAGIALQEISIASTACVYFG